MDVQKIFDLIKDINPGDWKIGVTYKSTLKLLNRGPAAKAARESGIVDGDYYKVVFRWCSAHVTDADKQAKNNNNGRTTSSGFHDSTNTDELNVIEYRDGTDQPCLILKHGPDPDVAKYYFRGQEIPVDDIQKLIGDKVLSASSISKLQPNEVFYLYPDKVQSIEIDGNLYENLKESKDMSEAKFNGIAIPDEDGFMDVEEELCEANNGERYFITKVYGDGDSGDVYYLGTDVGAAMDAVDNCYPDWEDMGLGGGDSYPATFEYIGNAPDFANLIAANNAEAAYDYFMNNQDAFKEIYNLEENLCEDHMNMTGDMDLQHYYTKTGNMNAQRYYTKADKVNMNKHADPATGAKIAKKARMNPAGDIDVSRRYDDEFDENLCEGSRAKFIQAMDKHAQKYYDRAHKLQDMSATSPSTKAAQTYTDAANNDFARGQGIDKESRPFRTSTDMGVRARNEVTQQSNKDAALRFKGFYNDNEPDKLAQRKPGTFAKEDLCEEQNLDEMVKNPEQKPREKQKEIPDHMMHPERSKKTACESVEQPKQKTVITEAMDREARKNGYRNYREYLRANK